VSLEGVELATQAVIQGVVRRDGEPVAGAYVRLLDRSGEFTAEVPTSATGQFRFFAGPGQWTLRTLAPRATTVERAVVAQTGQVAEVEVHLTA
jgi:hypothetical protein